MPAEMMEALRCEQFVLPHTGQVASPMGLCVAGGAMLATVPGLSSFVPVPPGTEGQRAGDEETAVLKLPDCLKFAGLLFWPETVLKRFLPCLSLEQTS
ncbi:hypothetical protein HGM15179_020241 [Zosterops borbonicus]|uniref:Uncharacterized protein n=1 Tax=Zosterops borbonicus TaxID=364589 RepID=A0A8K1D846_9PASS|nr:hypothetical protein HGM15179_020241 [Zosterops borbonicus]